MTFDHCIIGAGIVGLATARAILRRQPGASVVVLEKEDGVGVHQTGHNSGVIHAGIYYEPGSLKADLCKRGAEATKRFADAHGIEYRVTGKLLVATDATELGRMERLVERARVNGIDHERLGAVELRDREPLVSGVAALLVTATGIIDYRQVCAALAEEIAVAGGEVRTGCAVTEIVERADGVTVCAGDATLTARTLIACAGLQADRIARLAGLHTDFQIVPFRGEYYRLRPEKSSIVRHLIYPIPDPDLPFLGVHLSPTVDGRITVGPNAVLGFAREKYRPFGVEIGDVAEMLRFPGLRRVAAANVRTGIRELRNAVFKRGYLEECRKYCPSLELDDLRDKHAGIRAQAVLADGTFVHDFLIRATDRMVHVVNAPSPAATSALPIGEMIAERAVT
ncbi:L-2-hydroxyglutarate oxidase [Rhodococcus sp. NPDC127528]|uniref:L-2-hydroxyglutarate oxidase n=1 Tax=unclassified Rhodococcus (in: high G+C Gram-positive bacteria) TaxID=192944 RepID=UPI0036323C6F